MREQDHPAGLWNGPQSAGSVDFVAKKVAYAGNRDLLAADVHPLEPVMLARVLSQRELVAVVAEAERFPEFMLWVGAGASIGAGIPFAYPIVSDLLRKHRGDLGEQGPIGDEELRSWAAAALPWYRQRVVSDKEPECQVVLGRLRPSPALRNKYFSDLDARADRHSQGYKTLAVLLKNRVFDTVLTTNFDHLISYAYSVACGSIVAQPSDPKALNSRAREPGLIRLHGDLWNKNIANTR